MAYGTINARADSIATKPAYRSAFKKRRCLILADGYYEWLHEGKHKQPFHFQVDGGEPFAFAGLWECCTLPGEQAPRETCTVITTEPNELGREIHDRMPVILDPTSYDSWLDPENTDTAALQSLLRPFPADRMTSRPVSTYVNNVKNQGPECLNPPC